MRALVLLAGLLWCPVGLATGVELERLQATGPMPAIEAVRDAGAGAWAPAEAIRVQAQPSWWRMRVHPDDAHTEAWVIAIKEAYDAELVAYLPPDYRAQPLSTFDPAWKQVGSRHRLALQVPAAHADAPVYLQLRDGRRQPMRVSAAALTDYLAEDLARVRYTSMILAALLLLGGVATIYAVALGRWHLLLFAVWVACSSVYVLVMSGESAALPLDASLVRESMRFSGIAINVGTIAVYGFVVSFLGIREHYPRLARAMLWLLALTSVLVAIAVVDARSVFAAQALNLVVMALAVMSVGAAIARMRAGSPQGGFFLVGWGAVTVAGFARAFYFLEREGTPPLLEWLYPLAQVFGAFVLVLATARAARYAEREMHVARRRALIDPLTRLPNRAQLDESLARLVAHSREAGTPLAALFVDLDHFKSINDRFGHAAGDRCLALVSAILRRHVRPADLVARYGGEEFVVVLEGAGHARARQAAEELRAAVAGATVEHEGRDIPVTASIGLSDLRPDDDAQELLERADAALYRAKQNGRNRVEIDFGPPS
jgi:diguanylate cyclase (GGDEF)-like protein